MKGALCIRTSIPSMSRTIYGHHQRFLDTYYNPFKGVVPFFLDFARPPFIFYYYFFYLASFRGGLKLSLQEVTEVSAVTKSISYRSQSSLHPIKNPLSLFGGERHLALSEFFPRFLQIDLRVRLRGLVFLRLKRFECNPTLSTG